MSGQGEVALVLHTHLPWLKAHGVWPVGEEWLFQAWGESWYPVTRLLLRLAEEGRRDVLTLGVTPLVAWQVEDRRLRDDLGTWLAIQMWRAEEQRMAAQYGAPAEVTALGPFYWQRYHDLLEFHDVVEQRGGLLPIWADLASRGVIELLGGPATHPYLPLQDNERLIDGQLVTGLAHHRRWAGAPATGLWAPEMGYRPGGRVADPTAVPEHVDDHGTPTLPRTGPDLPGLEEHYARHGITHILVDAPTLVRAAGGRERDWTQRPEVPDPTADEPDEVVHDGVLIGSSDVVAYARDLSVAYHVWSPTAGYPGDAWYRDFFARGTFYLHPSWRVTDKSLPADGKDPYEPERALERTRVHAEHLHGVLRTVLDPRPGDLVVAAYDTELFGHWWFEGVAWLDVLLGRIQADPTLRTTTLASRLERRPPTRRLDLPESSWGFAKGHASWVTDDTREMWAGIRKAEALARDVLPHASAPVADQIARELVLLSSSDWPFLVARGNAPGYAFERFRGHMANLELLCGLVASGTDPVAEAEDLRLLNPVPNDPSELVAALRT